MTTTVYFQTLTIASLSLSVQNFNASAADFLAFQVNSYSDNAASDADEVSITLPIGTIQQSDIESLIVKGSTVTINGRSPSTVFWQYTGRVTDATFNLNSVGLIVSSPLRPVTAGLQLPGTVPFRVLTNANAGKLPVAGR